MRQAIVAGNWKMHGSKDSSAELLGRLKQTLGGNQKATVIVFPPFPYLSLAERYLNDTTMAWGAQDVNSHPQGAHTGEVSADMLTDFGCRYVLIGHSERRTIYRESNARVASKFAIAKANGLIPILCVGESEEQRDAGLTMQVIAEQIDEVQNLNGGVDVLANCVIAYEPIWAIGTGKTASPQQAQEVHAAIREKIAASNAELADSLPILYGGSVKANNAADLFIMPDIDGGLIGGASLDAEQFIEIARCIK